MSVTLAKNWDPDKHNVLGWYASEKLDGVRATFDGERFMSRNGKEFRAPYEFTKSMPKLEPGQVLDGELYMGNGKFNECSGIVRSHNHDWSGIQYHVFDIIGYEEPFKLRHCYLQEILDGDEWYPNVILVSQNKIEDVSLDVEHMLDNIIRMGGEGLMLKNPDSLYEPKRTSNLLKVKKFHDCEAICEGWIEGKGKYAGMIGALQCRLPSGATFQVGSGFVDSDRTEPPGNYIDKQITVKYFELSKDGIPRFPIYKGIRTDI